MKLSLHRKKGSAGNIISLHEDVISSMNGSLLRISPIPKLKHHLYINHHDSLLSRLNEKKSQGRVGKEGTEGRGDRYSPSILRMELEGKAHREEKKKFIVTSTMRKISLGEKGGRKEGMERMRKNGSNNRTIDISELMRSSKQERSNLLRNG